MEFAIKRVKIEGIFNTILSYFINDDEVYRSEFFITLGGELYGNHMGFYKLFELTKGVATAYGYDPDGCLFDRIKCMGFCQFLASIGFSGDDVDVAKLLINPNEWIKKFKPRVKVTPAFFYLLEDKEEG